MLSKHKTRDLCLCMRPQVLTFNHETIIFSYEIVSFNWCLWTRPQISNKACFFAKISFTSGSAFFKVYCSQNLVRYSENLFL